MVSLSALVSAEVCICTCSLQQVLAVPCRSSQDSFPDRGQELTDQVTTQTFESNLL